MIYDLAIVGSGFAGSLLAMIARRLGRSVVLIERGTHPRVVIGESSTPLSNLLLEELANRYHLPEVRPLSKWGSWQASHPELACGLKRGFTFYHHPHSGPDFAVSPASADSIPRDRQLLVAASPHDGVADTHWYRADFDHFLVQAAQRAGADYLDGVHLHDFADTGNHAMLSGVRVFAHSDRAGEPISLRARFVVDATGPRGFLHHALGLGELPLPGMPATQALYSHFSGVADSPGCPVSAPRPVRSGNAPTPTAGTKPEGSPPYPPQAAAVHHLFPGGWIWLLHFNNGVTSAGVACTDATAQRFGFSLRPDLKSRPGHLESAWQGLLDTLPVLREQFSQARAEIPFARIPRLGFRSAQITGPRWALLPSAAGFVDPLLSTGFPLTLLGVSRLASILESTEAGDETTPETTARLAVYAAQTEAELLAAADLIAVLYANLQNFPVFTALTMLYFAAASFSEAARRLGKPELAPTFLLHDHPAFGPGLRSLSAEAHALRTPAQCAEFCERVARAIEPINVAGLADPRRGNWYPVDAQDLFENAHKLHATREEIERLLARCGFSAEPVQS